MNSFFAQKVRRMQTGSNQKQHDKKISLPTACSSFVLVCTVYLDCRTIQPERDEMDAGISSK